MWIKQGWDKKRVVSIKSVPFDGRDGIEITYVAKLQCGHTLTSKKRLWGSNWYVVCEVCK
jgi:hypothetical protein